MPVDVDIGVVPHQAPFGLGSVVVVALINESGEVAEHGKSMCEASWYEELSAVVGREFYGNVLSVGGGVASQVNGHIEHGAFDHAH